MRRCVPDIGGMQTDQTAGLRGDDARQAEPLGDVEWLKGRLGLPSRQSTYRVMRLGHVPGVIRVGRRVRVVKASVESWLGSGGPESPA